VNVSGVNLKWCEHKWCERNCDTNISVVNLSDGNG